MNTHPEFELLDEYAFGRLDASEASRIYEHLQTCGSCRGEYEAIRPVIDVLPQALLPQSPPDALRDRILAAIDEPATVRRPARTIEPAAARKPPRKRALSLPVGLAAALMLALAGDVFLAMREPTAAPTHFDDKLVAALRTGRVYAIDGAVGGEPWHLTIVQPRDGERALIYSGTPDAPSGKTYRTWVVRGRQTFDAGELPAATPTTLEMPMALRTGDVVAFSLEPSGAGARPTRPFLMQLKITQ